MLHASHGGFSENRLAQRSVSGALNLFLMEHDVACDNSVFPRIERRETFSEFLKFVSLFLVAYDVVWNSVHQPMLLLRVASSHSTIAHANTSHGRTIQVLRFCLAFTSV